MKTRLFLIIAIVAALSVTGLNLVKVKERITSLQASLREQTVARAKADTDLAAEKAEVGRVNGVLRQTTMTLNAAKNENQMLAAKVADSAREVRELNNSLSSLQVKYVDARANLAAYEGVMTIEQVVKSAKTIKDLQNELDSVKFDKKLLAKKVDHFIAKYGPGPVALPVGLEGKVVAADPKWQFVVLDAGDSQGMRERSELLVSREGELVGKVTVRRVEKDRSVADIAPGWNLSDIREGDKFIAAHVSDDL